MAGSDRSIKDKKMAADLKGRGIPHGKRLSRPHPNSGGQTMAWGEGSAVNQRRLAKERRREPDSSTSNPNPNGKES